MFWVHVNNRILSISISALFKLEARLVVLLGKPINTATAENTNYRSLQCADLNVTSKDKGVSYLKKIQKIQNKKMNKTNRPM